MPCGEFPWDPPAPPAPPETLLGVWRRPTVESSGDESSGEAADGRPGRVEACCCCCLRLRRREKKLPFVEAVVAMGASEGVESTPTAAPGAEDSAASATEPGAEEAAEDEETEGRVLALSSV